jgi:hypothetical protein
MKTLQILFIVAAGLFISGCESRYRYTCQDPANDKKEECQRPLCEIDGVCPDQLTGQMLKSKEAENSAVERVESKDDVQEDLPKHEGEV